MKLLVLVSFHVYVYILVKRVMLDIINLHVKCFDFFVFHNCMCSVIYQIAIHHWNSVVCLSYDYTTLLKGRFLEFRMYYNFANIFSKLAESTFLQRNK